MSGKRKWSNYLDHARLSKRYHVYAFFISTIFIGALEIWGLRLLREMGDQIANLPETPHSFLTPLFSTLNSAALLFFAGFLLYIGLSIFFLIFIEQKVGGATAAILDYIEHLRKGNYEYSRGLREGDELKSIMEALHGLAQDLENKKK